MLHLILFDTLWWYIKPVKSNHGLYWSQITYDLLAKCTKMMSLIGISVTEM